VPLYTLHSYSLVDLRAGINSGNWRVELWGHNVTDKFYAQTVTHVVDTVARIAGMPATYGITVGYRLK
jgi:iron complex outermembrane receptor protein